MTAFYMKHSGLPISDLAIDYKIDGANHRVRIDLKDRFDSALLIIFAQHVLEQEERIRVIDNMSCTVFGPARIEGKFSLEVLLAGQLFDVKIVQMGAWTQPEGAPPAFTVSMRKRGNAA